MYLFSFFCDFFRFCNFSECKLFCLLHQFIAAIFPLTICIFTHALYILSFILKMVNRKSANCANYLQKANIPDDNVMRKVYNLPG